MAKEVISAPYYGEIKIGDITIDCAVLEDGTRVITQYDFYKAIGRSGKPAKGRGSEIEKVAPFLALNNLKPFVDSELERSTSPIKFKPPKGGQAWGYKAEILPRVCEVYLKARDKGVLLKSQEKFAVACDMIIRGLAHVGIIALVDEATGYQDFRTKTALAKILEQYLAKELQKWFKTFPDEFYKEMFRLRGLRYSPDSIKRPSYIGKLTNNIVYDRLVPGVRKELENQNPKTPKGHRKDRHHQWLTPEFGHPKLREHLTAVVALMKASTTWDGFMRLVERALPKYGELPLIEDAERRAKEQDKAAL